MGKAERKYCCSPKRMTDEVDPCQAKRIEIGTHHMGEEVHVRGADVCVGRAVAGQVEGKYAPAAHELWQRQLPCRVVPSEPVDKDKGLVSDAGKGMPQAAAQHGDIRSF
jgi:hypothetical protein